MAPSITRVAPLCLLVLVAGCATSESLERSSEAVAPTLTIDDLTLEQRIDAGIVIPGDSAHTARLALGQPSKIENTQHPDGRHIEIWHYDAVVLTEPPEISVGYVNQTSFTVSRDGMVHPRRHGLPADTPRHYRPAFLLLVHAGQVVGIRSITPPLPPTRET